MILLTKLATFWGDGIIIYGGGSQNPPKNMQV